MRVQFRLPGAMSKDGHHNTNNPSVNKISPLSNGPNLFPNGPLHQHFSAQAPSGTTEALQGTLMQNGEGVDSTGGGAGGFCDPRESEKNLDCLVFRIASILEQLHPSSDHELILSSSSSSNMDQEPWDITEEFNSAGGGLGSCGGGGGGGDFEVREPVVSQEYVSSIIRDSLEPLLNDFINNNSSNKADAMTSSDTDQEMEVEEGGDGIGGSGATGGGGGFAVLKQRSIQQRAKFPHLTPGGATPSAFIHSTAQGNLGNNQSLASNSGTVQSNFSSHISPVNNVASSASHSPYSSLSSRSHNRLSIDSIDIPSEVPDTVVIARVCSHVSKIQHWAENCPYGQIRTCLAEFLQSLDQSRKLPVEVSKLICSHLKTKYIPTHDIDSHNGLPIVESVYRLNKATLSSSTSSAASLFSTHSLPLTTSSSSAALARSQNQQHIEEGFAASGFQSLSPFHSTENSNSSALSRNTQAVDEMERTWDEEKTVEVERTLQFSQSQDDTEETKAGAGQERKEDIGSNSAKLTTSTTHEIARRKLSKSRNSRAVSASNLQVEKYKLYVWAFKLHNLRIPNVLYLLSYHPKYMATFLGFEESLLRVNFDLNLVSYLGIMAAARFDCSYLIRSLSETLPEDDPFVQLGLAPPATQGEGTGSGNGTGVDGGNSFSGVTIPPSKQRSMIMDVKALVHLNALLAHCPWKITAQTIKDVVEGCGGSKQWPQDKLVQAVIILAHFHSLSGFVLACGVMPDNDFSSHTASNRTTSLSNSNSKTTATATTSSGGNNSNNDQYYHTTEQSNTAMQGDYGTAQYSTWPRNGTVGHSASQLPLTTQSNAATVTHGANNMTGITPTCFANDNYDNAETMQNMSSNMDVGMCDSPEHSGGVTPCSGRVTPAHFFVDNEEGADFIEQLQSIPHRSDSTAPEQQLAYQNIVRHLSNSEYSSSASATTATSTTIHSHASVSKSNSITMRELGAQSSLDSSASGGTGLGIGASGGGVDGSSMCSSISSSVSTQYLKSSQISQHNRKYLGVEMGHCDFGADQPTETNEESLMRIVNSMDHLLEQNGSIHLKRKAEERIKTANNLTYNSFGKYGQSGNVNTTSFRRTIPCTCLMTHGILYDDFNYDLIDFFSSKHGRLFIEFAKRALIEPQTISKKFYLYCNPYELDHSEMVHICILVMEARMQIELYYAMKAINDYREMD
ncbi:uncharacterized protein LOC142344775 isoform X3 [Convolutriloba macropyga]|uniref:uncharacterized protein LOC142344775 isoform X3 n=1 Tax=Convolutriloba macropyga TaxID=536237 RepID=UPI003F5236DD